MLVLQFPDEVLAELVLGCGFCDLDAVVHRLEHVVGDVVCSGPLFQGAVPVGGVEGVLDGLQHLPAFFVAVLRRVLPPVEVQRDLLVHLPELVAEFHQVLVLPGPRAVVVVLVVRAVLDLLVTEIGPLRGRIVVGVVVLTSPRHVLTSSDRGQGFPNC